MQDFMRKRNYRNIFCLIAVVIALLLAFSVAAGEEETSFSCDPNDSEPIVVDTKMSNDAAVLGFFRNLVRSEGKNRFPEERSYAIGTKLDGQAKKLYDILRPQIIQVANGQRTSTEFRFPLSSICENVSYTLEELGYSSFCQDAVNAFADKTQYTAEDLRHCMDALVYDLPYDLYWFHVGKGIITSRDTKITYNGSVVSYADYENASITIKFYVSDEYAKGDFEVDPTYVDKAKKAAANAYKVIQDNKDKSDYQKLKAYRDWIRDHVTYNMKAFEDKSTPYGNPWQMIWVFDDDPNDDTKVVCEGFAKAFQFLCDNTSFRSSVSCICVSGFMSKQVDLTGAHRWNIVTMRGKRYLVDVTNDYPGSQDLFMVGYTDTAKHSDGKTAYKYAGFWFTYWDDMKDLYAAEEIAVTTTNYTDAGDTDIFDWNDPEYSWSRDYSVVTATMTSKSDPLISHMETAFATLTASVPATCTESEKLTYTSDEFHHPYYKAQTTTVEGTAALGHDWGETVYVWDSDHSKVTATRVCKNNAGHTETEEAALDKKEVTVKPGCETKGKTTYTSKAFANEAFKVQTVTEEDIPANGHKLNGTKQKAASCTEAGNNAYWTCSSCGNFFSDSEGKNPIAENSWVIEKLPHELTETKAKTATCIEAGNSAFWACSSCGQYFSDAEGKNVIAENSWVIAKLPHKLTEEKAKTATCTEAGNSAYWACGSCGQYPESVKLIPAASC